MQHWSLYSWRVGVALSQPDRIISHATGLEGPDDKFVRSLWQKHTYGIARIHERRSKVYIPDILESKWSLKGLEPIVQPDI